MTHDITQPRRLSSGQRSPTDLAHARGLALELRAGNHQEAARHARELAGLRGNPEAWPVLYEAELARAGAGAAYPPHAGVHGSAMTVPHAPSSGTGGSMERFYDAHPKLCVTAAVTVTYVGGLRANAAFPEGIDFGPFNANPSTWGALASLGITVGAWALKKRRMTRVAAGGTVGFALASATTRAASGKL
jgi:hypothetical protein